MELRQVGSNIRKIREIKNFTQDFMASDLEMTRETYGKLEQGVHNIKLETVFKIASILQVTVNQLLDFDPKQFFNHSNNNSTINGSNNSIHNSEPNVYKLILDSFEIIQTQHQAILRLIDKM